ncbi:MAG: hypothetical protein KKA81_15360 [Bacteroidetes bacterium]|nr:hypothetical protein [Bacteroidota bacterium]
MKPASGNHELLNHMVEKGCLKQKVYNNTCAAQNLFKKTFLEMKKDYENGDISCETPIPFEFKDKSEFETELRFAGDVLIFMMHTNVFQFPRDHFIHNTSYVKEDPTRSFCGMISIYNFLSDSIHYRRVNDIGYLIGRVFINKDSHFYLDGKRELRLLPNNFTEMVFDHEKARVIVESAIRYTVDFDLLVPPYDQVKEISVMEIISTLDTMTIKTGKRLGFKFQADQEEL